MAAVFAISNVLSKLKESLMEETIASLGVNEHVTNLESNLKAILCFMDDAAEKQDKDGRIRDWLAKVRDICYDSEDVLDDYALKVASKRGQGFKDVLKRYICVICDLVARSKAALELETLHERIKKLSDDLQPYRLKSKPEGESSQGPGGPLERSTTTSHHLKEEEIIGLEEQRQKMVSLLLNEEKKHPVIAICGMWGSGKTTLAKLIREQDQVQSSFEGFAWVMVGQMYRTNSVLQHILVQLSPELSKEIMHFERIKLIQKLSQVLESKKCLVVLDDLWSVEAWESLRFAFIYRETHSKVLITTRDRKLAERMAGSARVHEMTLLNTQQSWDLLKKALPNGDTNFGNDSAIETIGKDMVEKCRGLPLAVVMLRNLLASKSFSEWKTVSANIDSYLHTHKGSGEFNGITDVLSMSYNDLPLYLKPGFLYLGHFSLDSEIEAEKLYLLWMAEGLIPQGKEKEKETVMEIGSSILDAFATRGMIYVQVDEVPTIGKFKSCSLHYLMRSSCIRKAKAENFFEFVDLRGSNMLDKDDDHLSSSTRRLAVYIDKYEDGYSVDLKRVKSWVREIADHLRSLLFLNAYDHEQYMSWHDEVFNFKEFRFLRVLDFDAYRFQTGTLPKGIETLVHLRHLSLRGCHLKELPSYIGNLSSLETLDLQVTASCKVTIPNVLWKLARLRHLYLPFAFQAKGGDKLRFSGLRELQILKNFDTRVCHAQHLLELTDILILDATTSGNNEDLKAIIQLMKSTSMCQATLDVRDFDCHSNERHSIVTQLFSCNSLHSLHIDGRIRELPQINSSGLTKLFFRGSQLHQDPMATLEKLPHLWVLVLCDAAYDGNVMVCSVSGFPELRHLELSGLQKLQSLTIEKGAMPNLTALAINSCSNLEVPLDGLRLLPSLKELNIARMPIEFEDELQKVREMLYKVQQGKATPSSSFDKAIL